jgi:hypothetical protein
LSILRMELERVWLGMSAEAWLTLQSYGDLQTWWRAADSPAAYLLATLDAIDAESERRVDVALLPAWTATQALQECACRLNAEFSAQPDWNGGPAETGALAHYAQTPLLWDVLRRRPSRVLARVLARVYDMLEIASGRSSARLDSTQAQDGAGLAVVRTARGMLLHHVRLAADRVQDYLTVAPTEWNFHPHGALAEGLVGTKAGDTAQLARIADLVALSLDPCVEYVVELSHA